ncbi:gamma-glutamyl-gamma-aminobutyrate hydrolase family protein [Paramaledivibacter caminithermalis]|uniref:Putative glutamine amidotransferase n=1 Tax=Paramaledivibacter caminithermalis (strain DSM 15212 / CIP 107654 / DViRD3) TaxID=1121301 RepID=A0A1M6KR73_PARC5|nr:gamma-glutamyl-gamma-aminobutyrate hydrolase family protein [Paramaledivibacter caminithermalis]SHJ61380.1 putative glutamine amidotransferase [Paramaledivibacter caminithermalis DSM 15212]
MRPIIGITTFWENKNRPRKLYNLVSHNYIRSVQLAGGIPILIPLIDDKRAIINYLNMIDGIIFTGGNDISPLIYEENPIQQVQTICEERDEFEIELFLEALKLDMPILGVCRGMQLINVAMGGTLYQDIYSQRKNSLGHFPQNTPVHNLYHNIRINPESKLFDIFKKTEMKVNSFHHQGVKEVAESLEETSWAADGTIEAIEHINKNFVIGVQWHPEDLTIHHPIFLKLFEALLEEANNYRINKN